MENCIDLSLMTSLLFATPFISGETNEHERICVSQLLFISFVAREDERVRSSPREGLVSTLTFVHVPLKLCKS